MDINLLRDPIWQVVLPLVLVCLPILYSYIKREKELTCEVVSIDRLKQDQPDSNELVITVRLANTGRTSITPDEFFAPIVIDSLQQDIGFVSVSAISPKDLEPVVRPDEFDGYFQKEEILQLMEMGNGDEELQRVYKSRPLMKDSSIVIVEPLLLNTGDWFELSLYTKRNPEYHRPPSLPIVEVRTRIAGIKEVIVKKLGVKDYQHKAWVRILTAAVLIPAMVFMPPFGSDRYFEKHRIVFSVLFIVVYAALRLLAAQWFYWKSVDRLPDGDSRIQLKQYIYSSKTVFAVEYFLLLVSIFIAMVIIQLIQMVA